MFARITIQSGIAAGTSHRIKRRVARVGSDPQSDVCLPSAEIPGHALTLEFREDSCLVYNRCSENVYIGAQVVEPEQSVQWPETDILQLGQGIELLLDFDDSEIDDNFEEYGNDDSGSEVDTVSQSTISQQADVRQNGKSMKTAMQLGVTILCLAGCALLLIRDQNRNSTPDSGPGFTEIISTAIAKRDVAPELIQRLQHAEAQRIRGRKKVANTEYQSIRDDLVAELTNQPQNEEKRTSQILQFVQSRLGTIIEK